VLEELHHLHLAVSSQREQLESRKKGVPHPPDRARRHASPAIGGRRIRRAQGPRQVEPGAKKEKP
jgi:hypothetical protein